MSKTTQTPAPETPAPAAAEQTHAPSTPAGAPAPTPAAGGRYTRDADGNLQPIEE